MTVIATGGIAATETFATGVPRPWAVMPLTVIVPLFFFDRIVRPHLWLAVIPVAGASALLTLPILCGARHVRWWSAVPMVLLAALAWLYFLSVASFAVKYYSPTHVAICAAVQLAFDVVLTGAWLYNRRTRRFASLAAFHIAASVWLASYAFPYLSELP